jgi:putative transposase
MKAWKFADAQKAFILKQVPMAEICRNAGISQTTYFNWKREYDGLAAERAAPTEATRGRGLMNSDHGRSEPDMISLISLRIQR